MGVAADAAAEDAIANVEMDVPRPRSGFFIGSPNPHLLTVKDGVDVEAIFIFGWFHQGHCLLQSGQTPIVVAGKLLVVETADIFLNVLEQHLLIRPGLLPG